MNKNGNKTNRGQDMQTRILHTRSVFRLIFIFRFGRFGVPSSLCWMQFHVHFNILFGDKHNYGHHIISNCIISFLRAFWTAIVNRPVDSLTRIRKIIICKTTIHIDCHFSHSLSLSLARSLASVRTSLIATNKRNDIHLNECNEFVQFMLMTGNGCQMLLKIYVIKIIWMCVNKQIYLFIIWFVLVELIWILVGRYDRWTAKSIRFSNCTGFVFLILIHL